MSKYLKFVKIIPTLAAGKYLTECLSEKLDKFGGKLQLVGEGMKDISKGVAKILEATGLDNMSQTVSVKSQDIDKVTGINGFSGSLYLLIEMSSVISKKKLQQIIRGIIVHLLTTEEDAPYTEKDLESLKIELEDSPAELIKRLHYYENNTR